MLRQVLLAAAAAGIALSAVADVATTVLTDAGYVDGVLEPNARVFRGIPFATPPTGPLRWLPPVAHLPWSGVLSTKVDAAPCLQDGEPASSEDCLFLNVFTPLTITEALPILLYIHGGAFVGGSAGTWELNASQIVSQHNIIVVSIQYRLGAAGFLAVNSTGDADPILGNSGLLDQQFAMQWVKRNIAAFGGDASRVTISGQSAGGMSVAAHLVMPSSDRLFSGAISQSDPWAFPYRPVAAAVAVGATFAQFCNCTQPQGASGPWIDGGGASYPTMEACLRAQSSATILSAQDAVEDDIFASLASKILYAAVPWAPTTGTDVLPQAPLWAFPDPDAFVADVPTVIGTVRDELYGLLYDEVGFNVSAWEYDAVLPIIFGLGDAIAIGLEYPVPTPPPEDFRAQICDIGTPAIFRAAARNATLALAARPGRVSPVWRYSWNHVSSFAPLYWGQDDPQCWYNKVR